MMDVYTMYIKSCTLQGKHWEFL